MDELFAAFNDDVRQVVRQTAKMAVLSSREEQPIDNNSTVSVWGGKGLEASETFLAKRQQDCYFFQDHIGNSHFTRTFRCDRSLIELFSCLRLKMIAS